MFVIYGLLAYGGLVIIIAICVLRSFRTRLEPEFGTIFTAAPARARRAQPLHRSSIHGRGLRFFRSPLAGPDFPWAILRDLFDIATGGASYMISSEWIYANSPTVAQPVMTDQGPEMMLSHRAAVELIRALISDERDRDALIGSFREVLAEAYVLQWAGLSREEFRNLCAVAERRPHTDVH